MLKAKCDICNQEVAPALNKAALARNMGLHKWRVHGVRGTHYQRNQAGREARELAVASALNSPTLRANNPRGLPDSMLTPQQLARRQYQRDWARKRAENSPPPPESGVIEAPAKRQRKAQEQEVIPCRLSECPNCGSRFYMARGGQ